MANSRAENVIFVDTDNTVLSGPVNIKAIKYFGAATSSASLKSGTTSGALLWQEDGTADVVDEVYIKAKGDVFIDITGTASILIYLE